VKPRKNWKALYEAQLEILGHAIVQGYEERAVIDAAIAWFKVSIAGPNYATACEKHDLVIHAVAALLKVRGEKP
jgi:hypothetical protein